MYLKAESQRLASETFAPLESYTLPHMQWRFPTGLIDSVYSDSSDRFPRTLKGTKCLLLLFYLEILVNSLALY